MTKVILQRIRLPTSPARLYNMYMNPKSHAAITGHKVMISRTAGAKFSAFNGMLVGRTLKTIPHCMIVQAWRAKSWKKSDPDSILIFTFQKAPGGAKIDLIHVNVPSHDYQGVKKGWANYYWKPWKAYLKRTARKK